MPNNTKNIGKFYRTWVEISKSAISHNIKTFKKHVGPSVKLLGVVKSNAYGHELISFSKTLAATGVDFLGVDSITEARTLRNNGIKKPILVLGYTLPANLALAADKNIAITVSTFENLKAIASQKKNIAVHIKIDTGMHRQGFYINQIPEIIKKIKTAKNIHIEGVYTHLAAAKKPDSNRETEKQISNFKKAIVQIKKIYPHIITHAAATAGTLNYPEAHFDMVRVGIGLYGLWPSEETKNRFMSQTSIYLEPTLSWKTIISEVKAVEKGAKIGYDYTEIFSKKGKIAILPVGYWHGYFRILSGKSHVLIKGIPCKVLGRVSMDMLTVDVSNVPNVKVGDEVTLIGKQINQIITADELAKLSYTTSYEFLTRINPLIKKFYR